MPDPSEGAKTSTIETLNDYEEMTTESVDSQNVNAPVAESASQGSTAANDEANTTSRTMEMKFFNTSSDKYSSDNIYVYVESTTINNLGKLHPIAVGHILHKKLKVKNISQIKSIGKNRIKIQFKNFRDANSLINNSMLNAENLRAFIPKHLLEKKGIIKGVDTQFDNDYLIENIKSTTPILEIRRMNRKIENNVYVPKQTVIITFEGNIIPNYVTINSVYLPVEEFVGKPIQCYSCLKYGHISKQCRSSEILCIKCGKIKKGNEHVCGTDDIFCIYCKSSSHISISASCPYKVNQQNIRRLMCQKNLSFFEARNINENLFSSIVSKNNYNVLALDANGDKNDFPELPIPRRRITQANENSQPLPRNIQSYTKKQNIESISRDIEKEKDGNRKRKATSPLVEPSSDYSFPFRFGPSQPLPINPQTPQDHHYTLDEQQIKAVLGQTLTKYIEIFLERIQSIEDLSYMDNDSIKKDIESFLESNFTHH